MKYLKKKEFNELYMSLPGKKPWYLKYFKIMPRAFVLENEIYINIEAFYLNDRDKNLLIMHEDLHIYKHLDHTLFGIMSDNAVIRYLTTWCNNDKK
jgi:hypothetical protein